MRSFDKTQLLQLTDEQLPAASACDGSASRATEEERKTLDSLVNHYLQTGQLGEAVTLERHFKLEHEELECVRVRRSFNVFIILQLHDNLCHEIPNPFFVSSL